MIGRYLINCDVDHPELPFIPVTAMCGSARTIGVIGLPRQHGGVKLTSCRIRVTNADGETMTKQCAWKDGVWCATFPASHFSAYGAVKRGVVVLGVGKDENGNDQAWILRVGDLKVQTADAAGRPGIPVPGGAAKPGVYVESEVVDGVQHFKKERVVFDEVQGEWGAVWEGDYILTAGEYVKVGE